MNSGSTPRMLLVCALIFSSIKAADSGAGSLHGVVTDPSGALVPGALVQLRGTGGEKRKNTDAQGAYSFAGLPQGQYTVRVIAQGFTLLQHPGVAVGASTALDLQLSIEAESQVVNVEEEANKLTVADPNSNADALVLGQKELAALSDDPDELSNELQALAGPGAGPNGGEIYIDGFTGGTLPPKSSIREVRINSNPFSPEYDRPGFGRIQIFTKPGTDSIRGQAFFQFNNQDLNTRSPLLETALPAYKQEFFGFNLSGPVIRQKASFTLDYERRLIDENAFVLATTLDSNFNPQTVNQGVVTPQTRQSITPRFDYAINATNTLTLRYQDTRIELDKQGVGGFNLASQAYNEKNVENTFQGTETAILSAHAINETRFQFMHSEVSNVGNNSIPAIVVAGAFTSGGAQIGNSGTQNNEWEITNTTSYTAGTHAFKWGGRLRQYFLTDTSVNNFGGTYTFLGGQGPELDANNNAIAGTMLNLTALQVYQRTLLLESLGDSAAQIRALGGGATQFSIGGGRATSSIHQFDAGLFFNDDWRLRPNLTLSYGLRYETQTNIHDFADLAPRLALAWGIGAHANQSAKTVLRLGAGVFYDRILDTVSLNALRFNGTTQQSYLVLNPNFFPTVPTLSILATGQQPQQLQSIYNDIKAPRNYQATASLERQINKYFKLSGTYIFSQGVHLQLTRDVNAPIDNIYPYGTSAVRLLTESTGMSRSNQLIISPNFNYKKIFLFGFYGLSYGQDNNEGEAANPYNLRAEWGPSTFSDVRHRFILGTNVPLPFKVSLSPFIMANSGTPYNIVIGQDLNGDSFATERPSLVSLSPSQCSGAGLVYAAGYGCFNLNPALGAKTIGRNYGRGPGTFFLNMRLSRTWSFGDKGESGPSQQGPPPGMGGARGGPSGPPPGGGPGGGGPPPGLFGAPTGKKYNLTLSLQGRNILNHPNFGPPNGNLSSPYFGQSLSLAGFGPFGAPTTYDRKIDIQLRFAF